MDEKNKVKILGLLERIKKEVSDGTNSFES